MSHYLLALDQGTSSSRALLFNVNSNVNANENANGSAELLATQSVPLVCLYPQPGWVEQQPNLIWESQRHAIAGVLATAKISARNVRALGISNQRETVIAWHRDSGEPLANAIVWQCRRTTDFCQQLKVAGRENEIRDCTGLVVDPYFSASKMRWLLDHEPAVSAAAKHGKLCFGTVDSWLIWKLTNGRVHATDASNAARTQLFNIHHGEWDDELLKMFGIPRESLPRVCPSSGVLATTDAALFGAEIEIAGVAGDQQAALFGQACFAPGLSKNTYGTGCFMLMNTGTKAVQSQHGLLSTVAWKIGDELTYALEGSVFVAGALIQWLRDNLGLFENANDCEALARQAGDNGGVYIVPAFVGLGAPHWDAQARGIICGLTRGSSKAHVVRAALEAVAYQNHDLLTSMEADTGISLPELRIDGGMVTNNFLCQFQADVLQRPVIRSRVTESSALGVAMLAGLATGVWSSLADIGSRWQAERKFLPQQSAAAMAPLLTGWQDALAKARR